MKKKLLFIGAVILTVISFLILACQRPTPMNPFTLRFAGYRWISSNQIWSAELQFSNASPKEISYELYKLLTRTNGMLANGSVSTVAVDPSGGKTVWMALIKPHSSVMISPRLISGDEPKQFAVVFQEIDRPDGISIVEKIKRNIPIDTRASDEVFPDEKHVWCERWLQAPITNFPPSPAL